MEWWVGVERESKRVALMEWDLKLPPWDLADLELDAGLSIGPMVGSNSGSRHHVRVHDCSVDLKLGGAGDLGPHKKWKDQSRVTPAMVPSSSGTSKRARAASNGNQTASCSVDGCLSDLSKCREYHRRHKVCEDHSKTAIVLVGGREQRFCQQCSRFHSLAEFDETKRSCRKRLDGHNRRRRKSQPDYLGTASLIANHQGGGFSAYPQIFPTATPQHNWTRIIKSEDNALYTQRPPLHFIERQQNCLGSSQSCKVGKQFPFLHDSTASSESSSGFTIYTDGIAQALSSDCALSLLSSPPRSLGFDLSQIVPSTRVPIGQPLVPEMQFGRHSRPRASATASPTQFSCSTVEDGHMIPSFVPDASDTHLHCLHVGVEGSSDGTAQTLPFYWQ